MTNPFLTELDQGKSTGNPFLDELEEKPKYASYSGGALGKGLVEGVQSTSKSIFNTARGALTAINPATTLTVPPLDTSLPESTSPWQSAGRFVGEVLPSIPISMATAGMVNPLFAGPQVKVLGKVAAKTASFFSKPAVQAAVEKGIITIPQEVFSGMVTQAAIEPEAFATWRSTAKVAALSSIGTMFNGAFAYRDAIKKATTPQAVQALKEQIEEIFTPPVSAAAVIPEVPDFLKGNDLPSRRQIVNDPTLRPAGEPAPLPTHYEAAMLRIKNQLAEQAELKLAQLAGQEAKTPIEESVSFLQKAKAEAPFEDDVILRGAFKGIEERMGQLLTVAEQIGKGMRTLDNSQVVSRGPTAPVPNLTFKELQDHLNTLNMGDVFSDMGKLDPELGTLAEAPTSAFLRRGKAVKVDPVVVKKFHETQARLDAAAAEGRTNVGPEEFETLVGDMMEMSRRLARGYDAPRTGQPLRTAVPNDPRAATKTTGGDIPKPLDLPTSNLVNESMELDPSHKRWVTGSDAPPPATNAPTEVAAVAAVKSFSESVQAANISYRPQRISTWDRIVNKIKNRDIEFHDRTLGIGKHFPEAQDHLSALSGVSQLADDWANVRMSIAVVDPDGVYRGKTQFVDAVPLKKSLDKLTVDDVPAADAYLKALTLKENPRLLRDMADEDIDNLIEKVPTHIKQFADNFKKISDALVDDAVALGRLTKETGDAYKSTFFAGLKRDLNEPTKYNPFKKRSGSADKKSLSPIQLMYDGIFTFLESSRKNHAFSKMVDGYYENPQKYEGIFEPAELPKMDDLDELIKEMKKELGISHKAAEELAWLRQSVFDKSDDSMVIFHKGVPTRWKINQDIKRTMETLGPLEHAIWRSVLKAVSIPTRVGVSTALDISGIGPLSDALLTSAAVPEFNPLIDPFIGLWHSLMKSDEFLERAAAGGHFGGRFVPGEEAVKRNMMRKTGLGAVADKIVHPFETLQSIIRPLSDASRMGEYLVRTRKMGETPLSAAMNSRRTLGDFNRHGASMRAWAQVTEFGNVGIQTFDAATILLKKARTDPKVAMSLLATGFTTITAPTIGLWAIAQGDDELNSYRLSDSGYRYWWYRNGDGEIKKMQKPGWWMGQLFGSTFEGALDAMAGEDKKKIAARILDGGWNQVGINPIPLKIQNAWGLADNKRSPASIGNRSIPITPQSQIGLEHTLQGNEGTSGIARNLADKNIANPFVVDYVLDAATGGLFSSTVKMMSGRTAGNESGDFPIFGRFSVKRNTPTEGSGEFYKDLRKANEFDKNYKAFMMSGQYDKADAYFNKHSALIDMKWNIESTAATVSQANKDILNVMRDPEISMEGKKAVADEYRKQMNEAYAEYLKNKREQ